LLHCQMQENCLQLYRTTCNKARANCQLQLGYQASRGYILAKPQLGVQDARTIHPCTALLIRMKVFVQEDSGLTAEQSSSTGWYVESSMIVSCLQRCSHSATRFCSAHTGHTKVNSQTVKRVTIKRNSATCVLEGPETRCTTVQVSLRSVTVERA
jgi:hypothetical protein